MFLTYAVTCAYISPWRLAHAKPGKSRALSVLGFLSLYKMLAGSVAMLSPQELTFRLVVVPRTTDRCALVRPLIFVVGERRGVAAGVLVVDVPG